MTKNVDTSLTTPNLILTCSSRALNKYYNFQVADYTNTAQPHWATGHLDTWSVHIAAGLLHYSTSHASTALLMATELLYNTNNNTDW